MPNLQTEGQARWGRLFARSTLIAASVVILSSGTAAAAHFLGNDSVDDREIRYENQTIFDDGVSNAISVWNAVGSVDLKPDSATTIADLQYVDVRVRGSGWDGRWVARTGADNIELNRAYLDGYSAKKRRSVVSHETGHAYGIGNHQASTYGTILMYYCSTCSGRTSPNTHDKSDYRKLWG